MDLEKMAKRRRELTRKDFPSEVWFMKLLNEHGLFGYRRNMPIASRFFGDFVWRRLGTVVEIDGKSHIGKEEYDRKRDKFIESLGIKIYRIKMNDFDSAMLVINEIKSMYLASDRR